MFASLAGLPCWVVPPLLMESLGASVYSNPETRSSGFTTSGYFEDVGRRNSGQKVEYTASSRASWDTEGYDLAQAIVDEQATGTACGGEEESRVKRGKPRISFYKSLKPSVRLSRN